MVLVPLRGLRPVSLALVPLLAWLATRGQGSPEPVPLAGRAGTAELVFEVRERGAGPLPARLTFVPASGGTSALFTNPTAAPDELAARDNLLYTRSGTGHITVPPGHYTVVASRGLEWSLARAELELVAGAKASLVLELVRALDTRGCVSADFHLHTLTHSGHGDASLEERVLSFLGEGLEFAVASDHGAARAGGPLGRLRPGQAVRERRPGGNARDPADARRAPARDGARVVLPARLCAPRARRRGLPHPVRRLGGGGGRGGRLAGAGARRRGPPARRGQPRVGRRRRRRALDEPARAHRSRARRAADPGRRAGVVRPPSTQTRPGPQPTFVDLRALRGLPTDHTVVYAQIFLSAPEPRTVLCAFGSDDGARVWLAERLLYEDRAPKSAEPLEALLELPLAAGWNRLVLEIENQTGDFGFYCRLLEPGIATRATPPDRRAPAV